MLDRMARSGDSFTGSERFVDSTDSVCYDFFGDRERVEQQPGAAEHNARGFEVVIRAARRALSLVLAIGLFSSLLAAPEDFPRPGGLRAQIEFWKKIFTEYSENQVVIHDAVHLDKIYAVVDVEPLAKSGADGFTLWKTRKLREKVEKNRIDRLLQKLHTVGPVPGSLSSEERVIWELYRDVNERDKFKKARERVRGQQGLRDRFRRGLEVSRRYLPYMEEVFRREGLPVELTRLPFVESSFNLKAYSKVGAAGIWQFIPSSARIYSLRMNDVMDDRRDPIFATQAAVRHLKDDYETLGSWPLAITAYNHGRAGIARAVKAAGSRDLVTIIRRYNGKAFGFASRNFYAEFLAALEVERDHAKYFSQLSFDERLRFDEVVTRDFVPFSTLARLAGCSPAELAELNPAFVSEVTDGKLYVPKGHRLRVPEGRVNAFQTAYAALPASQRFDSQRRYYVQHRVVRGQTLGAIAKRYRTTVAAIQVANNLRDARRLRIGQILKIPSG